MQPTILSATEEEIQTTVRHAITSLTAKLQVNDYCWHTTVISHTNSSMKISYKSKKFHKSMIIFTLHFEKGVSPAFSLKRSGQF